MTNNKTDGKRYVLALDAGGTMTDTFLGDEKGHFVIGKALTSKVDESQSYLDSVRDACSYWGLASTEVHSKADFVLYTGTVMLNVLLTRTGRKVGLLVTRGFEDMHEQERGLTWLGMSYQDVLHAPLRAHNPPLVDRRLVRGIPERIGGGSYYGPGHYLPGKVIAPMNEEAVRQAVGELLDEGVEAIGITFIYSYVNPQHEKRAAEIAGEVIREREVECQVVTSQEIIPIIRETSRLNSVIVEAVGAEPARKQLQRIERVAQDEGYKHELLTMLSYGGTATSKYPRMHESMISGPVGGMLGSAFIGKLLGLNNIVTVDIGGTSVDVGLIVDGILEIKREPDFANRRVALPMVSVDSIGAGAGMNVRIDPGVKRILLGPESAGSDVGFCLNWPTCTISDINVALGYLNPDYFLGGHVKLDKDRALQALKEQVADPLGGDPYEIGEGVLDLIHSKMGDHLGSMLLSRGFNVRDYSLLAFGGAGPIHMWGTIEGLAFGNVITFPWAAAFSAFGNATADSLHRLHQGLSAFVVPAMTPEARLQAGQLLNHAWDDLEKRIYQEFEAEGLPRDKVRFRNGVYARYVGQIESIEAAVPLSRVTKPEDMDTVIQAFDKAYVTLYPEAASFAEAGYFITEVFVEGVVEKVKPVVPQFELEGKTPPKRAHKAVREVFHKARWQKFDIWEMDELKAGNRVAGPSIIEHPMTTLVIPPGKCADFDQYRIIHYKDLSMVK